MVVKYINKSDIRAIIDPTRLIITGIVFYWSYSLNIIFNSNFLSTISVFCQLPSVRSYQQKHQLNKNTTTTNMMSDEYDYTQMASLEEVEGLWDEWEEEANALAAEAATITRTTTTTAATSATTTTTTATAVEPKASEDAHISAVGFGPAPVAPASSAGPSSAAPSSISILLDPGQQLPSPEVFTSNNEEKRAYSKENEGRHRTREKGEQYFDDVSLANCVVPISFDENGNSLPAPTIPGSSALASSQTSSAAARTIGPIEVITISFPTAEARDSSLEMLEKGKEGRGDGAAISFKVLKNEMQVEVSGKLGSNMRGFVIKFCAGYQVTAGLR